MYRLPEIKYTATIMRRRSLEQRFFRIRSVDMDNSFKLSSILRVNGSSESVTGIQLYPVPAVNQVYVQHAKVTGTGTISILSPEGMICTCSGN